MSTEIINRLFSLSRDSVPDVRAAAAYGLGETRITNSDIITCLITLSNDPVSDVRAEAAKALGRVCRPIPKG